MTEQARSPWQLAMGIFVAKRLHRLGLWVVAVVVLLAVYAPFLAGETALVWWHDGFSLPILADLFNRRSYPKPHDLLFNVVAVVLPFLILGWRLWRADGWRKLRWSVVIVIVACAACLVPCIPRSGTSWQALWSDRPTTARTSLTAAALQEAGTVSTPAWLLPPIPHRSDATYQGALLKAPGERYAATGARFWLGTDAQGHDVAALMLHGARISLTVGLLATGLSLLIGLIIGAVSGYFGGWVDLLLQRVVEIMMCFPTFILVLAVVAMTSRDIFIIMLVLGLTGWADIARLVRGEFLAQAVRDYVVAAEAMGLPRWRIMFRHILPNTAAPLLITATFGIAGAIGIEAGLAFLGLGDPTVASWGGLLNQGRENIRYAWLIYTPGLAIFVLVLVLNLIGNGLREALDPRAQR